MTTQSKVIIISVVGLILASGIFIGGMFTGKAIWGCKKTDDNGAEVTPLPPLKPPTEWKDKKTNADKKSIVSVIAEDIEKKSTIAKDDPRRCCGDRIDMRATIANNVLVVGAEDKCKKNVYTYKIDCPYMYKKYTFQLNPIMGLGYFPELSKVDFIGGLEFAFIRNWKTFGVGCSMMYEQGFVSTKFKMVAVKAIFQFSTD